MVGDGTARARAPVLRSGAERRLEIILFKIQLTIVIDAHARARALQLPIVIRRAAERRVV